MRRVTTITLYLSVLLFLLCTVLHAGAIRIDGADEQIQRIIEKNEIYYFNNVDSLAKLITNAGYLQVEILEQQGILSVLLGKRCYLSQIVLDSQDTIHISENMTFVKKEVEQVIDNLVQIKREEGYLFANYRVDDFLIQDSLVTLYLSLDAGPEVLVNNVIFEGVDRTDPVILSKYIHIDSLTVVSSQLLNAVENEAASIPFIKYLPPAQIQMLPGYQYADVLLNFRENKQFVLQGGAGYITEDKSLVWAGDMLFTNLFGGGRQLQVRSEKKNNNNQLLQIQYSQPFMIAGRGTATAGLSTRDYRDQFYEFELNGKIESRISKNLSLGFLSGWKSVEPSGNMNSFSVYSSGLSFRSGKTDQRYNPGRGYLVTSEIEYMYRKYAQDSTANQMRNYNDTRVYLSMDQFWNFYSPFIMHIHTAYTGLETKENLPPVSELYLVGGPGTIRGFRNEQFTAIRALTGSIEPRYRFSNGFLFLFYDSGYLYNRINGTSNDVQKEEIYRYGYGWGISLSNIRQSVAISFGWNNDLSFDQPRLSIEFSSGL